MSLPSPEQKSNLFMSLSQDLTPHNSSPEDVTDDILVSIDPSSPFNHSHEFEVGEDLETPSKLDMSIKSDIEHHEIDE